MTMQNEALELIKILSLNIEPPQAGQLYDVTTPAIIEIAKRLLKLEEGTPDDGVKVENAERRLHIANEIKHAILNAGTFEIDVRNEYADFEFKSGGRHTVKPSTRTTYTITLET